jgi:hypothetical protein
MARKVADEKVLSTYNRFFLLSTKIGYLRIIGGAGKTVVRTNSRPIGRLFLVFGYLKA